MKKIPFAIATFIIVSLACGCASKTWRASPRISETPWSITQADLSLLKSGDTADEVIAKLGMPIRPEISIPWFAYYASDHHDRYYVFQFDQRHSKEIRPYHTLDKVMLTAVPFSNSGVVVWSRK